MGGDIGKGILIGGFTFALGFGTIFSGLSIFLKISAGLNMISYISSTIPDTTAQQIARYTGYASMAFLGMYMLGEIWKGIKYGLFGDKDKGFYNLKGEKVNPADIKGGSSIFIGGQGIKDINKAIEEAMKAKADYVFFNPSHGLIADFTESIIHKLFPFLTDPIESELIRGLSQIQGPVTIIAHSQGTIFASNALAKLALKGGVLPVKSRIYYLSPVVTQARAYGAALSAGISWGNIHYIMTPFDPIGLVALNLNPIELFSSVIGTSFLFGFWKHGLENYASYAIP